MKTSKCIQDETARTAITSAERLRRRLLTTLALIALVTLSALFLKQSHAILLGLAVLPLLLGGVLSFTLAARRVETEMTALAHREQDLECLFLAAPTAMLLLELGSLAVLRANQRTSHLMGRSLAQIVGSDLRHYLPLEFHGNRDFLARIDQERSVDECEVVLLNARSMPIDTLVSVREVNYCGQSALVLGLTDITPIKKAQQALEHHATFDDMTGLMNRRTGLMMLGKSMASAKRDARQLAVCFIDLDGLKAANDSLGHSHGDWLIRTVAEVFTRVIRSSDAAIRLGGDEFLLMLRDCSIDECERLVARAKMQVAQRGRDRACRISFSHGVVSYAPQKHASADELMAEADCLMYLAKQEKRQKVLNYA
ncbi:MAG: GGDEF domain-containing protein [Comamonadaceae bacterium]